MATTAMRGVSAVVKEIVPAVATARGGSSAFLAGIILVPNSCPFSHKKITTRRMEKVCASCKREEEEAKIL